MCLERNVDMKVILYVVVQLRDDRNDWKWAFNKKFRRLDGEKVSYTIACG